MPAPEPADATLDISTDAPSDGRHRVDPGSELVVTLAGHVVDPAADVRLVAAVPPGWAVTDAGGGTLDPAGGTVTWSAGDLPAGSRVAASVRLRAPTASPAGDPAFEARLEARLEDAGGTAATAMSAVLVAPALVVEHSLLAQVAPVDHAVTYLEPDTDLDGLARFDTIRVRFQVRNADLVEVGLTPRLQFAADGDSSFRDVPIADAKDGVPVYQDAEWRSAGRGRGTTQGPPQETIPVGALRVQDTDSSSQEPQPGRRFMDEEQAIRLEIAGDSYTEIEFTLRLTRDIGPQDVLRLRLSDAGNAIRGASVARVRTGSKVAYPLSPGQHNGVPVGPPVDATPAAAGGVDFPLVIPAAVGTWPEAKVTSRYQLVIAGPPAPDSEGALAAPFTSMHTPDTSLVSDTCATCHRAHDAQSGALLAEAAPVATMCFICHDGTGSTLDTTAQYTDAAVPANDPATRSYFRHDAVATPVAPNTHSLAQDDEFGGVSNRHSECADCHNSHNASAATSTQFTDGWSVPGQLTAVSGVAVTNDQAGEAPTYTLKSGTAGDQPDREYQLCLKCHSGYTVLPENTGAPSTHALDKGIELNPENASYHPVEAAGKNATSQMAWSLANSSPYKQWNFATNSTVRCVNCHGDPRKYDAATPPDAGSDLAPHTSQFRGLLIQNYRDRVLKAPDEAYDGADFALCYVCHAEQPYRSSTPTNTRFDDHDLHVSSNAGEGPGGTDIDMPGQGGGNALCAECHFRSHSTAQAFNEGDRANAGLVNFAPNVEPYQGVLEFTRTATGGTCTLTCHGKDHDAEGY